MNILLIHQNFPGQFLNLAQYILSRDNNNVVGLGETNNIRKRGTLSDMKTLGYATPAPASPQTHHYLQSTEREIRQGQAVVRALFNIQKSGFVPDVVFAHPGWGEGLFLRDFYPKTPIMMFAEFFFKAGEADLGIDPEFPYSVDWMFSVRIRNATQLISFEQANVNVCPTHWQASRYPWHIRKNIHIQHDGIDTHYMCPSPTSTITIQPLATEGESNITHVDNTPIASFKETPLAPKGNAISFTQKSKVISYIARNLEPYRGFHTFMRSIPAMQEKHPDAHFFIIGGEKNSYSPALPNNETYKEKYLQEMKGCIDLTKIHFLGRIPYVALRSIFRITKAHVYLTYPFVLSWSTLEAMACEALVIASRTPPVEEVIQHNHNGFLFDFFATNELAACVDNALTNHKDFAHIRKNARKTVQEHYELQKCLATRYELIKDTCAGKYPLLE